MEDRQPSFMRLYTHGNVEATDEARLEPGQVIIMPGCVGGGPDGNADPRESVLYIGGEHGTTLKITWHQAPHHGGPDEGPVVWEPNGEDIKGHVEKRDVPDMENDGG